MELKSTDLVNGATIAKEQVYTRCGGLNISPQLSWSGAPAETKSFALTMIDFDAKPTGWIHWWLINLPESVTVLSKGEPLLGDAIAVKNDFGNSHYDGPCPPRGSGVHHYEFTVWALPVPAPPPPAGDKLTPKELSNALAFHALAKATLTGTYETP